MNIAILGYDTEGKSSYEFFKSQHDTANKPHMLTILDQNPDLAIPDGANSVLGDDYLDNLARFDLIVRTAGLNAGKIFVANPELPRSKVTTQINEFFKASPTTNIIGVTGTKGKGTTSTLIHHMLAAAGKDVHLAGNIGIPALSLLPKLTPDSWVVLELSSFQLSDLRYSPMIAVCLMVVPEHLNWHKDMADYKTAKQQLFVWQTFDDIAIYNADNEHSHTIAEAGNGTKLPYMAAPGALVAPDPDDPADHLISIGGQTICRTSELKLLGEHNWQNVCAAITAVWQVTHNISALHQVLTSFSGLPHRLELVREIDGVKYYNDSFATGIHASIAAIQAIKAPKVLILGGFERNLPLEHLAITLSERSNDVRKVLIIGESAERLAGVCQAHNFSNFSIVTEKDIKTIVALAQAEARNGDAVLLSPGFASYDMFKNFEDRGNQYRQAVQDL